MVTPDVVFVQELGGQQGLGSGVSRSTIWLAGEEFVLHVTNSDKANRAQGILFRAALDLQVLSSIPLPTGVLLHAKHASGVFHLASFHLPHAKRSDVEEVWQATCECLDAQLAGAGYYDFLLLGADVNQDLQADADDFSPMMFLRSLLAKHGLLINRSCGFTWTAQGHFSEIDFLLYRNPCCRAAFHTRDDMRVGLPSDHLPLWGAFCFPQAIFGRPSRPQFACGRWLSDPSRIQEFANSELGFSQENLELVCKSHSTRYPSLRYVDSDALKDMIRRRRVETDPRVRASMLKEIKDQRAADKTSHKVSLLERAKQGDRAVIAHLRRSALQASFECSYIQARGGGPKAADELRQFYEDKFRSFLPAPTPDMLQALIRQHAVARIEPFTKEELERALLRAKKHTSSGMDSVCYEAVKLYQAYDARGKLLHFFNRLLLREESLPQAWKRAKVVLLPKIPCPQEPGELRPICLSPVLSKIYGRMIMLRVAQACPPYQVGQLGCRPKTQTIDGIFAAETVAALVRRAHRSQIHMAKLDIKAAFDSLSHSAIISYLRNCRPCAEVLRLWEMVVGNTLTMSLGDRSWQVPVEQGVMQGSAYSADLFGRVIDWHLRGLPGHWDLADPTWKERFDLPHFLLYADDLLLFASSPQGLQAKFRDLVDCLRGIGLSVNLRKCHVLNVDGSTPAVFPRSSCLPLQGQDRVVFLGLPIAHTNAPDLMLAHSLRKMSNTYQVMRQVLNQAQTPHRTKALLFHSSIASKWCWGCGAIWPSVRALKSIDGLMNSLLLGIFRFQLNPFATWLENKQHRRRAMRLYCQTTKMDTWSVVWLTRVWTYMGHVARCQVDTPLRHLVACMRSSRLALGGLRPSWLSETIAHKFRLCYQQLCQTGESPYWERQAQDRQAWMNMLPRWLMHWNRTCHVPTPQPFSAGTSWSSSKAEWQLSGLPGRGSKMAMQGV